MFHGCESAGDRIPAGRDETCDQAEEMKMKLLFSVLIVPSLAWAQPEGLPEPAAPPAMKFAVPQQKKLANGMSVIAVERPGLPVITAGLIIRAGAEADPAKLGGLAQFTGGLLTRGTTKRGATQIAEDLEDHGASLKIDADWDQTLALLESLSTEAGPSLEILAEVIRMPAFAKAEIERLRKETVDELTVDLEQPGQLARVAAARAILGTQPYGHSTVGTPASLRRVKRADITSFHVSHYRPDRAVLIVAGSLSADEVFALAEKYFGDWRGAAEKKVETAANRGEIPKPSAVLIDMPDAGQAAVYIGRAAPPWREEDYYIGQMANGVLGGGFSSRLNREVRIKRGLSYGCGSRLSAYRGAGMFGAAAQTKNESAADVVEVVRGEMSGLGREVVPDEEFNARKAVITGSFQRELETNEGYVKRIADFVVHEQAVDSFATTLEKIEKVKPAEVKALAEREFDAGAMTVVVVGKRGECEKPLRKVLPKLRIVPQAKLDLESAALTAGK
jgi:zinc protease